MSNGLTISSTWVRGEIERNGEVQPLTAVYRFSSAGQIQTPMVDLPGGGRLAMTGINPNAGKVQFDVSGVAVEGKPARLSIDVTRKPLIQLVWGGLYVILAGGALSTWKRFRGALAVDEIEAKVAKAKAARG